MRLLIAITNQGRRAAVYFNRELDEYTVRFYSNGEHLTDADYFTDCKSDAYNTMNHYAAGMTAHTSTGEPYYTVKLSAKPAERRERVKA